MDLVSLIVVAAGLLAFALVSGRLEGSSLTAPLFFVGFGLLVGQGGLGIADIDPGHAAIHMIAEFTLVLLLFSDAARLDLERVRRDHNLPLRMLLIGLPLAIAAGVGLGALLFPGLGIFEIALLAALLAPTDAALGQAVVSAKEVPARIRQTVNVESGLNDGIALPAVVLFAALASMHGGTGDAAYWIRFALMQVLLGPLVGVVMGFLGARGLDVAAERGWMGGSFQGIGILALAVVTFALSEAVGGNGFIAAFVGGMVFGNTLRHECRFLFEFMETEGQLLTLITFLIFGAAMLPEGLTHFQPVYLLYALGSLTIVRMLPIALSLLGSGVKFPTMLFVGWFGPRGLASILFVLLILEEAGLPNGEMLLQVTVLTVALSTLVHGVTAGPLSRRYGRRCQEIAGGAEMESVTELPLRKG